MSYPEPRPMGPREQPGARERAAVRVTPVFGTTLPLRGVSGVVRRAAYRVPEHRARHWLLLLLADRIDVFERSATDRALANPTVVGATILVAVAIGLAATAARR